MYLINFIYDQRTAFVTSFGVFTILALVLPKPKPESAIGVSAGPKDDSRRKEKRRKKSLFPSGTNKVEQLIESARDSYHHFRDLSGKTTGSYRKFY